MKIKIENIGSAGITAEAEALNIESASLIGEGYAGNGEHDGESDWHIKFYSLRHPKGWDFLVADTNGDPVWEAVDPEAFATLADQCGVSI